MDRITLKCAACGSDQFEQPENPKPDDKVACAGCGKTWVFGELKAAATEAAKKHFEQLLSDRLGKAFKKR